MVSGFSMQSGKSARWSPDLGRDIGSVRWIGELVLLTGLIACALSFWFGHTRSFDVELVAVEAAGAKSTTTSTVDNTPDVNFALVIDRESLRALLTQNGVRAEEARQADRMISAEIFPDNLKDGTNVALRLRPSARHGEGQHIMSLRLRPRLNLALAVVRSPGRDFELKRTPIPVQTTTERLLERVIGIHGDGIAEIAGAPAIATEYIKALAHQVDVPGKVQVGDFFDLVITVRQAADGKTERGEVLYAALTRERKQVFEVLRWGHDGRLRSAETIGSAPRGASMWPVNGRFTSGYGLRFHPILGYSRMHAGIDISSPAGTPIYAVSDGLIVFAGWHGGHGNYIRMDQADGQGTGYAHLSRIAVTSGEHVVSGQVIGYVGSTGLSTGPHLHYEVYRHGRTVDPLTARFARPRSGMDRGEFQTAVAALKALSPIVAARVSSDSSNIKLR